jgi:hypothetical protein
MDIEFLSHQERLSLAGTQLRSQQGRKRIHIAAFIIGMILCSGTVPLYRKVLQWRDLPL